MNVKRSKKLIEPRLQLKSALAFACVAGLAVLVQALILNYVFADLARRLPSEFQVALLSQLPAALLKSTVLTIGILLPVTLLVGVTLSFRLVGPLYSIKRFLRKVIDGEQPEDCRVRAGDELHDLCSLVNSATEPVRRRQAMPAASPQRRAA